MKKISYIKELANSDFIMSEEYGIIYALIMTLTPKQSVDLFDLKFEQNYKIRQWTINKIANDIQINYSNEHKELVSNLLKILHRKSFKKRNSCGYSIDTLFDGLPIKEQTNILEIFLESKYSQIRKRAYKRLYQDWDTKYEKVIISNWEKHKDSYCLIIMLNHFTTDFLKNNYKEFIDYLEPYQLSRLFLKLSEFYPNIIKELESIDNISYAYVLTKLGKKLTMKQARKFLDNNYLDDRISLLIWCFGKMGLWNAIVDFNDIYKERINIEKYGS